MLDNIFVDADLIQEIAGQIEIGSDLTIQHPQYQEWSIPELVVARIQASPRDTQAKFLCTQLQNFLHCLYFSRSLSPRSDSLEAPPAIIGNNTLHGIDAAFFARLNRANCSQGYYDHDWQIQCWEDDELVAVVKDGLRLCVSPTYIHPDDQGLGMGDRVAIVMPKNLMTIDRYIAIGSYGRIRQPLVTQLYFHCLPDSAVDLMTQLSTCFDRLAMPFEVQILLDPQAYPRADALIVAWAAADDDIAQPLVDEILAVYQSEFFDPIPAFTQPVARGVGKVVTEQQQDFPQHIWRSISQALAEAWLEDMTDVTVKLNIIRQKLQSINLIL